MPDELVPIATPLSAELANALNSAVGYAGNRDAASTRRGYRSDFVDFSTWCSRGQINLFALPAEPATVAAYFASLADRRLKVSTIERRVSAIAYVHRRAGFLPPTSADNVKAVIRGIRRGLGVEKQGKAPATAKVLSNVLKRIPEDLVGKRDRALLLIAFAAALRRSELVGLEVRDLERAADGIVLHLGATKTDQDGAGAQIAVPAGRYLKPVAALNDWLKASNIIEGPVFRSIDRFGRLGASLSAQSVALIVKKRFAAAKLDASDFSGHSLRAGFVSTALENGADVLKVMDITRHKRVDTLKVYDRRAKAFKNHAGKGFL